MDTSGQLAYAEILVIKRFEAFRRGRQTIHVRLDSWRHIESSNSLVGDSVWAAQLD